MRKKTEGKRTEREEEDFNGRKKMVTELPCQAHFARYRHYQLTTDVIRTKLGITLWRKQNDNTIGPMAFASKYLNDPDKIDSFGELELLAVVLGIQKFRFYLYGEVAYLYRNHQALEPLFERNRAYRQYNTRLVRLLVRVARFIISKDYTARKKMKFTDYLSRKPIQEASTEELYQKEDVIINLSELSKLKNK